MRQTSGDLLQTPDNLVKYGKFYSNIKSPFTTYTSHGKTTERHFSPVEKAKRHSKETR